jgi:hypothetical protein
LCVLESFKVLRGEFDKAQEVGATRPPAERNC